VLEIVDANGIRYGNCRQPGDTSTNFTSICMNDDISVSPHNTNSSLDFQVPGTPGSVTTFYAHVFDWRGDSRPDMTYGFGVSGAALPLAIPPFTPQTGTIGAPYGQALNASGGLDPYTWTVDSGSLPPGIILQNFTGAFGFLTGMPTTAGKFPFTLKVTDGTNPKQSATVALSIDVSTPLVIASAATFPDACVNQPYSFQVSATGGTPPFAYILGFFGATTGLAIDKNTGLIAGIPTATGTFPGFVQAFDSVGRATQQIVGLTVKTCP
jgi:large repetitive protein